MTTTNTKKRASTRTSRAIETSMKAGRAKAGLPLTWSAQEYVPRKRWWWYLAVGYTTLTLTFILIAIGNWSAGLLTAVLGIAIFILYLPKPKVWDYQLAKTELRIVRERRRGGADEATLELETYRAFVVEQIAGRKGQAPYELLVLLPRGRFAPSRDIYLTGDEEVDSTIGEAIRRLLPYGQAERYRRRSRLLDRLARLLRTA